MSDLFMTIVAIGSLVLWVVLLVAFFQLVGDVRKIKARLADKDSEYFRYANLAKEEHALGNIEKEREYLIRAQCHAYYAEQEETVRKLIAALDRKNGEEI